MPKFYFKKIYLNTKEFVRESLAYRRVHSFFKSRVIKNNLRRQLESKNIIPNKNLHKKIFIPLIETSHYQFFQVALIAKALMLRGAEIKILVCDESLPACEIKSSRNLKKDPCLNCRANRKQTLPEFGIETINFSEVLDVSTLEDIKNLAENLSRNYPKQFFYYEHEIIRLVNDSVTRYYYGNVPDEPSLELDQIREKYLITLLMGFEAARKIYQSWNPDVIFGNMEVYCDWAPYYQYFKSKNVEAYTISMSQFNYKTLLMNQNDLFKSNERYITWLKNNDNKRLSLEQKDEIEDFISKRFKGDNDVFRQYSFFDNTKNKDDIVKLLDIQKSKQNIFLFSNVYWDVGMSEFGELYEGVIDWVISSIRILKENKNLHLYIKPHPSEAFDVKSSKGVIDAIYDEFVTLPSNVTIIYPEMKILTYDLFEFIDLGVVYNGTLGLEMLFEDIPVIACGKTPYGNINLVSQPKTQEEYKKLLLNEEKLCIPDKENLLAFAYFYFIKTLIPWDYTETAYGNDNFNSFQMKTIKEILPNENYYLDHICKTILYSDKENIDSW